MKKLLLIILNLLILNLIKADISNQDLEKYEGWVKDNKQKVKDAEVDYCDTNGCVARKTCWADQCTANECVGNQCYAVKTCWGSQCIAKECVGSQCIATEECWVTDTNKPDEFASGCIAPKCHGAQCQGSECCEGDNCTAKEDSSGKIQLCQKKDSPKPPIKPKELPTTKVKAKHKKYELPSHLSSKIDKWLAKKKD